MELAFSLGGSTYAAASRAYHDASIAVRPLAPQAAQVSAFRLPPAAAAPFAAGSFVASIDAGGSINCAVVSALCAHGNGTHTECVGHALPGAVTLRDVAPLTALQPALLLSVAPAPLGAAGEGGTSLERDYAPGRADDLVVSAPMLRAALRRSAAEASAEGGGGNAVAEEQRLLGFLQGGALVVRTLPNAEAKRMCQYGGTNPTYLTRCAAKWAVACGVQSLLIDLPSADREDDCGLLIAHRTFWELPPLAGTRGLRAIEGGDSDGPLAEGCDNDSAGADAEAPLCHRTITELIFVPDAAADGPYLLDLQVAPIELDAAPSRPLLYPLRIVA